MPDQEHGLTLQEVNMLNRDGLNAAQFKAYKKQHLEVFDLVRKIEASQSSI